MGFVTEVDDAFKTHRLFADQTETFAPVWIMAICQASSTLFKSFLPSFLADLVSSQDESGVLCHNNM